MTNVVKLDQHVFVSLISLQSLSQKVSHSALVMNNDHAQVDLQLTTQNIFGGLSINNIELREYDRRIFVT